MTWSSGGLFANLGDIIGGPFKGLHVLDFAGGTVVYECGFVPLQVHFT